MDAVLHLNIYLFPMILLACIFVQIQKNAIQTMDNRLFKVLLLFSLILFGLELSLWCLTECDFPYRKTVMNILTAAYLLLIPIVPLLWVNYVYFHLKKVLLPKTSPIRNLLLVIPLAIYYFFVILANVIKWITMADQANAQLQKGLYAAPFLLSIVYMMLTLYMIGKEIVSEKVVVKKRQKEILFFFISLPFLAVLIQMNNVELWITLPATAVAELLVYLLIQRQEIMQDALTGINNRRSFDYYLNKILDQGEKKKAFCLFMMDLDYFKEINDTCGHAVGDEALMKAANLLSQVFQSSTGFVARFGGDEFCAIELCRNQQEADDLIKRLESVFEESNRSSTESYRIAISVGYAFLGEEGATQNELIERADERMYQNKKRRKRV